MSEPTDETPLKEFSSNGEVSSPSEGKVVEDVPPKYAKIPGVSKFQNKMKNAKDDSSNQAVFFYKACGVLSDSGASLACLLPLAALSIAMIVIGAIHKDHCSGQRYIPIWLIVFGTFSLLQTVTNILRTLIACFCCRNGGDDGNEEGSKNKKGSYANQGGGCCECLISLFLFIWIIVGSVWVFQFRFTFYSERCSTNPLLDGCCYPLPYLFAFGSIVAIYALAALTLVVMCCCLCCCVCCLAGIGAATAS